MGRGIARSANIIASFKILKGNARTSVMFEPMWGIPFVLLNFYLSLYMKGLGITDRQIGYLIFIGFISGTVFSLFAGVITDRLGRKRTTLIFDLISWPGAVLIYLFANSFWLFALATVVNNVTRIVAVSWNLMIIEDSTNDQRIATFNLMNIITISTGVIIPAGGILVNAFGVVVTEKVFLAFAAVSMTAMMLLRNHFYFETSVGKQILEDHRHNPVKNSLKTVLPIKAAGIFKKRPLALVVVIVFVLFNIYIPLGTYNSLYFAPYMTEVLRLSKSTISVLGGVYAAAMFVVFVFINPVISRMNQTLNMIVGLLIQILSLIFLMVVPSQHLVITIFSIVLFALGYGIFRPFIDSLLAEVTECKERAGVYAIVNTVACVTVAFVGLVSGSIYAFNPRMLYAVSIGILLACAGILIFILKTGLREKKCVS